MYVCICVYLYRCTLLAFDCLGPADQALEGHGGAVEAPEALARPPAAHPPHYYFYYYYYCYYCYYYYYYFYYYYYYYYYLRPRTHLEFVF